jgi:hypothetical protein
VGKWLIPPATHHLLSPFLQILKIGPEAFSKIDFGSVEKGFDRGNGTGHDDSDILVRQTIIAR